MTIPPDPLDIRRNDDGTHGPEHITDTGRELRPRTPRGHLALEFIDAMRLRLTFEDWCAQREGTASDLGGEDPFTPAELEAIHEHSRRLG